MNSLELKKQAALTALARAAFTTIGKGMRTVATAARGTRLSGAATSVGKFGRQLGSDSMSGRVARGRLVGGTVGAGSGYASAPEGESFTGKMSRAVIGGAGGGFLGGRALHGAKNISFGKAKKGKQLFRDGKLTNKSTGAPLVNQKPRERYTPF